MNFQIKILKKPTHKNIIDIEKIYREAGWWYDYDNPKKLLKMIKGSYIFAIAIYKGKIIAMARVISDETNDAYIQDFAVLKKYRRIGIGGKIIKFLTQTLIKKKFKWIGLISEKKAISLYKRCRFKVFKNKIPMIYEF